MAASGRGGHDRVAGQRAANRLLETEDHAIAAVDGDPHGEVRAIGHHLDGARVIALDDERLASGDGRGARDAAGTGGQHVLAVARRVDEHVRNGLREELRQRPVLAAGVRQVPVAHDAADTGPGGPLGARPSCGVVLADRASIGHPELVVVIDCAHRPLTRMRTSPGWRSVTSEDTTSSPRAVQVCSSIRMRKVLNRSSASRMKVKRSATSGRPASARRPRAWGGRQREREGNLRGPRRGCRTWRGL